MPGGRGPVPKPASRRARTNKDPIPTTMVDFEPGAQPDLPEFMPDSECWPKRTREWWEMWGSSPLSRSFTANDWSELLDTAALHGRLWRGDYKAASELRLRVAKFGATPEDRARLRIQFAQADEADAKRPAAISSREKYGALRAVEAG